MQNWGQNIFYLFNIGQVFESLKFAIAKHMNNNINKLVTWNEKIKTEDMLQCYRQNYLSHNEINKNEKLIQYVHKLFTKFIITCVIIFLKFQLWNTCIDPRRLWSAICKNSIISFSGINNITSSNISLK